MNHFYYNKTNEVTNQSNEGCFFPTAIKNKPIPQPFCNYNKYFYQVQVPVCIQPDDIDNGPGDNIYKKANQVSGSSFTFLEEKAHNGYFEEKGNE
jgi:hypothetical protein